MAGFTSCRVIKNQLFEEFKILKTVDKTEADQLLELINKGGPEAYEQEIKDYEKRIKINPKDMEAYYNLEATQRKLGHYKKASDVLDEAMKVDPNSTDTYNRVGDIYWLLGRYEVAVNAIKKSLEINPNQPKAHYYLAQYYLYKGNVTAANMEYMALISLDKDLAEQPLRTTSIDPVSKKTLVGFDMEAFEAAIKKANEKYDKEMPGRN